MFSIFQAKHQLTWFFGFTFILLHCETARAATIKVANLTPVSVQTAINAAANGDTIVLPAGSATWTSGVTITNKSIRLMGAGIDQTIITRNTPSNGTPALTVTLRPLSSDNFYMAGLTFQTANKAQFGIVSVGNSDSHNQPVPQFRITNCKMTYSVIGGGDSGGTRALLISGAYGLIDHCHFITTNSTGGCMVTVLQDNHISTANSWHTPQAWGDVNSVCMEDNFFDAAAVNDGAIDVYNGQRVTFRHNAVRNTSIGGHGYDSSVRSARSYEIYQNKFYSDDGKTDHLGILIRGGTALIWGNTFDAGYGNSSPVAFNLYASDHAFSRTAPGLPEGWPAPAPVGGTASGSSPVDGNFVGPGHPDQGYPLLDQIGRGSFPSGISPGSWPNLKTGYSVSSFEALDPVYQWNNNVNGNTHPVCGFNIPTTANYVKVNRDYYDNVPKPSYTPLVYPHPLAIDPPTGLHVN